MKSLNEWTTYLTLIRLMHDLKVPFEDRMSLKEFEEYAKKIRDKETCKKNQLTDQ